MSEGAFAIWLDPRVKKKLQELIPEILSGYLSQQELITGKLLQSTIDLPDLPVSLS